MNASRAKSSKAPVVRGDEHRPFRASKVLAGRSPAVAAVGAWVEDGQDVVWHPCELASITEELQAERRRLKERSLQRFQEEVRHRVARVGRKKLRKPEPGLKADRKVPEQRHARAQHESTSPQKDKHMGKAGGGGERVRLRLAARRTVSQGDLTSAPPRGDRDASSAGREVGSDAVRERRGGDDEEVDETLFAEHHRCHLVQHKRGTSGRSARGPASDADGPPIPADPCVLWPPADPQQEKRRHQTQFLMNRRLFMKTEREQVKENTQHRKHLRRTARIKAAKEEVRQEEETRLERARQISESRRKLAERELLVLERLRLEEEERSAGLERRRRRERGKVAARYIEAMRAQVKERLSQGKLDPPPLCCCAASFWDSHPDTCANNCVFHDNPKAYIQALRSAVLSLDLQ